MDYRIFNVRTDINACDCTRGCMDTRKRRFHWKFTLLEKSLAAPGNRTCVSGVTVRCCNQLSCIPTPRITGARRICDTSQRIRLSVDTWAQQIFWGSCEDLPSMSVLLNLSNMTTQGPSLKVRSTLITNDLWVFTSRLMSKTGSLVYRMTHACGFGLAWKASCMKELVGMSEMCCRMHVVSRILACKCPDAWRFTSCTEYLFQIANRFGRIVQRQFLVDSFGLPGRRKLFHSFSDFRASPGVLTSGGLGIPMNRKVLWVLSRVFDTVTAWKRHRRTLHGQGKICVVLMKGRAWDCYCISSNTHRSASAPMAPSYLPLQTYRHVCQCTRPIQKIEGAFPSLLIG